MIIFSICLAKYESRTYTYNSRNFVFKIEKSTNAYKNVKLNLEALASNHDQIGKIQINVKFKIATTWYFTFFFYGQLFF